MLPQVLKPLLRQHPEHVQLIHARDLSDGFGGVILPYALERKHPNSAKHWRWQFVFSQANRWMNVATGVQGRQHVDESIIQEAFARALDAVSPQAS